MTRFRVSSANGTGARSAPICRPIAGPPTSSEASGLDYAVLRPAWLTDADEIDYETTTRNEPFNGTIVSRKSVAALAVDLILNPERITALNLGVNKPNTDGDSPDLQS